MALFDHDRSFHLGDAWWRLLFLWRHRHQDRRWYALRALLEEWVPERRHSPRPQLHIVVPLESAHPLPKEGVPLCVNSSLPPP